MDGLDGPDLDQLRHTDVRCRLRHRRWNGRRFRRVRKLGWFGERPQLRRQRRDKCGHRIWRPGLVTSNVDRRGHAPLLTC